MIESDQPLTADQFDGKQPRHRSPIHWRSGQLRQLSAINPLHNLAGAGENEAGGAFRLAVSSRLQTIQAHFARLRLVSGTRNHPLPKYGLNRIGAKSHFQQYETDAGHDWRQQPTATARFDFYFQREHEPPGHRYQ